MKLKRAWWGPVRESPPEGESADYGRINGALNVCFAIVFFPLVMLFFWLHREKPPKIDPYDIYPT